LYFPVASERGHLSFPSERGHPCPLEREARKTSSAASGLKRAGMPAFPMTRTQIWNQKPGI